jgi:hypothetical protein
VHQPNVADLDLLNEDPTKVLVNPDSDPGTDNLYGEKISEMPIAQL